MKTQHKEKLINISELAKKLKIFNKKNNKLATHTLRFWEKEFKQIKPTIITGRRYYAYKDVEIISMVKFLLKDQGLTIAGVKKVLKRKLNNLDDNGLSSIKSNYIKNKIKLKTNLLLNKINKFKNNG